MAVEVVSGPLKTLKKNMSVLNFSNTSLTTKNKIPNFNIMSKSKKLQKQISPKLEKLDKLIDKIVEAKVINSDDPETWDSDALYNLVANLKEALQLLQDQLSDQLNDWGEPMVLEEGLCSLVDEYHSEEDD